MRVMSRIVEKVVTTFLVVSLLVAPYFIMNTIEQNTNEYDYYIKNDGAYIESYNSDETEITIPSRLGKYKVIGVDCGAFDLCDNMVSISIPASVTEFNGNPFSGCRQLKNIDIPLDHPTLDVIDGVLFDMNNSSLICYPANRTATSYEIPEGIEIIHADAFYLCQNLENIIISQSVLEIGEDAFGNSKKLKSVTFEKGNVVLNGNPFAGSEKLESIYVANNHPTLKLIDGVLFDCTSEILICYPSNRSGEQYSIPIGTKVIGDSAFWKCVNLNHISIPEGVTRICNFAFADCDGLLSIDIPNSVKEIGENGFSFCDNIASVKIPEGVETVRNLAFAKCNKLEEITILGDTEIQYWAFLDCEGLKKVSVIGNAFIFKSIFDGCDQLQEILIPEDHPTLEMIEGVLFNKENNALFIYPAGRIGSDYTVPEGTKDICDEAFEGAHNLKSVKISLGVERIGSLSFNDCEQLEYISIPNSVVEIDRDAFGYGFTDSRIAIEIGVERGSYAEEYAKEKKIKIQYED